MAGVNLDFLTPLMEELDEKLDVRLVRSMAEPNWRWCVTATGRWHCCSANLDRSLLVRSMT